jgi:hypothetical protein
VASHLQQRVLHVRYRSEWRGTTDGVGAPSVNLPVVVEMAEGVESRSQAGGHTVLLPTSRFLSALVSYSVLLLYGGCMVESWGVYYKTEESTCSPSTSRRFMKSPSNS